MSSLIALAYFTVLGLIGFIAVIALSRLEEPADKWPTASE
jgi:hypothetical protein